MTPLDRTLGSVPSLVSACLPPEPIEPSTSIDDLPSIVHRRFSGRLIGRAFRRHWWQAVLLWAAGSIGLMILAHDRIKPTFRATSAVRVDPRNFGSVGDPETFRETQAQRITQPNVIARAIAGHPELSRLSEREIRQALSVMVVPRTSLIEVSMTGEVASETAEVVNAVVETYLKVAIEADQEESDRRFRTLLEIQAQRTIQVTQKRDALAKLVQRTGSSDPHQTRDRNLVTIETYKALTQQLLQADLELVQAQARLDQLRIEPRPGSAEPPLDVVAAFHSIPRVSEVQTRLTRARAVQASADRIARDPGDQSRVAARKKVEELQLQIDLLWARQKPLLSRTGREADRRSAETQVSVMPTGTCCLGEVLEMVAFQTKLEGADELTLEFTRQDLSRAQAILESVIRNLDQVEIEVKDPASRFRQEYRAQASDRADAHHRAQLMAVAPMGMLLAVLGLITLVEFYSSTVADPQEIPDRLNLRVLGVVPPLPRARTTGGRRSARDLDQFIQSLDHLRVAICAGKNAEGRSRKTILITSACGSEGKTTLAAQLAERSVNAGLSTLLIDADLRNPTLSRMFDAPTSQGLVNILRGEAMAEEAITIISEAGGFHFLPAGTPRVDPGRLLQGERLPRLLARARQSFDLVIVDSPPVLPVPDALTIGQWVDGAVLAVRFENSRYPLVDRANRRLASVGVPVIGAVINGVREAEAAYYDSTYGDRSPVYA